MESFSGSPTARALQTLELLQIRPGITADELGQRLGVTDRAARRYVAILREAGVPVESTRGPYGGYRLGRGLRPPPLVFTADEALGLVMAVLDGHHAPADLDDPVGAALGKLVGALPNNARRPAATMRQHALAVPDRRAARPDPSITSALADAIATRHRIHLSYQSGAGARWQSEGSRWQSEVDPWAIVVRHGRWYLLCFAHHANAGRAYRIDRIERVRTLDVNIDPPPEGLDPVAWLEHHLGTGWEHETHVVFDSPVPTIAPYITPPMGQLKAIDNGARASLKGTTSTPTMYAGEWLAAIPYPFHVIGGPELRKAVAEVGHRMTAALDSDPAAAKDQA